MRSLLHHLGSVIQRLVGPVLPQHRRNCNDLPVSRLYLPESHPQVILSCPDCLMDWPLASSASRSSHLVFSSVSHCSFFHALTVAGCTGSSDLSACHLRQLGSHQMSCLFCHDCGTAHVLTLWWTGCVLTFWWAVCVLTLCWTCWVLTLCWTSCVLTVRRTGCVLTLWWTGCLVRGLVECCVIRGLVVS